MIKMGFVRRLTAIVANLTLLLNSFLPFFLAIQPVYAQSPEGVVPPVEIVEQINTTPAEDPTSTDNAEPVEAPAPDPTSALEPTNTPEPTSVPEPTKNQEPTPTINAQPTEVPTPEPTNTPDPTSTDNAEPVEAPTIESTTTPTNSEIGSLNPATEINPTLEITQTPSPWTFEKVELNKEYVSPQNSGVKLIFTKLPENSGNITIEEITLTPEQIIQTGSLSDKAYDITSDMVDGSFAYNLSLPIPESSKGKSVDIKFAEDILQIDSAQKVDNTTYSTDTSVSVKSLDHMTIFVVTNTVPTSTIDVSNLQPSWTAIGAGGVWSSYSGPSAYNMVSPGINSSFDGREAGIIKAGLNIDGDGHYRDDGIFGFKPTGTINNFASGVVSYDVENQEGTNPVWMTIEIDTGVVENRNDDDVYQFVPTTNPTGWHTVDAKAGLWQKWTSHTSGTASGPLITLNEVASTNDGLNVTRAYLRLGMGDSYHGTGSGTIAWVDKVTLGGVTYDFVVTDSGSCTRASVIPPSGTTACYSTIQAAITAATPGDTINVAAGTYTEHITINKNISLVGADKTTTFIDGTNTGVVVTITTNNVTVKNFTVKNSGTNINTDAGLVLGGVSNVTIENNIITNNVTGLAVMSSSNNSIKNNEIKNSARYGIVLEKHPSISSFSTLNTISENTLTSNFRDGIYAGQDCNSNTITNNSISGATGTTEGSFEANGIYFWKSSSNTVTGNTIFDNTRYGIEMHGSSSNNITKNTIKNNLDGFHIRNINVSEGWPSYNIENNNISKNKIYDNTRVNLYANPNFDFNVENNWWGNTNGAMIKSKIASWDASGDVINGTTVFLDYTPWCMDSECTIFSSANAITVDASDITSIDATLNGTNGDSDASNHTFWVSLNTFVPALPVPAGIYSTPPLGSISAGVAFAPTLLSSFTTNGVPSVLPPISPNTTYYYAAWSEVNGTWYPGEVESFTTLSPPDITAPVITGTPSDITVEATSASGATVTYTNPTATDNVDVTVTVTCLPVSGSTFAFGTTSVTCNATDAADNHATPTIFNVIVQYTSPLISGFTSSESSVRENNHGDLAAQVKVPSVASDVRFTITGVDLVFNEVVTDSDYASNGYNNDIYKVSGAAAGSQWWRVKKDLSGGKYSIAGEFEINNVWYPISGSAFVYSINTPWFNYVIPSTTGLFFRPTDMFARLKIDDQYNQTNSVSFEIFNSNTNAQVGGEYTVSRANCDLRSAGEYIICDLMRDYTGVKPSLVAGAYYLKTQSSGLAGSGIRYQNTQSLNFNIDGTRPILSDLEIDNSRPIYKAELVASALSSDNNGIANVEFYITSPRVSDNVCDGNGTKIDSIVKTAFDGDGRYRATFDTSSYNGQLCVNAMAVDASNSHSDIEKVSALFDNTAPVISLNGIAPNIEVGGSYVELGATAVDAIDGSFAATPSGSVNTSIVDAYIITYNATDSAGNVATPVTRTVNVVDTVLPSLTSVSIISNNIHPKFAKQTNKVTVSFTADENLVPPVIKIAGVAATVTGSGATWSAVHTMNATDAEGYILFTINFSDLSSNAGLEVNTTTNGSTVWYDRTKPTVSITTTETGPTKNTPLHATITFSEPVINFVLGDIAVTNGSKTNFVKIDPTIIDTRTYVTTYSTEITPLIDGVVTINILANKANDVGNNANVVATQYEIFYDATPPTITINNPNISPDHSKTLTATVSGGSAFKMAETTGTICDNTLTTFVDYSDKTYSSEDDNGKRICYQSEDLAGNFAYELSDAIDGIDWTAPTYNWNSPAVDSIYADGQFIYIDASIIELGGGITDGATCVPAIHFPVGSFTGTVIYSASTNKCTGTITLNDPSYLGDGTHHITLNVADKAGNSAISTDRNILIDNTDPTSTIDGGPNNGTIYSSTWNGFISGTASDLTSGVKEVQLTVQKTDGQYWTGSTWQVSETLVVAVGTTNWTYQIGTTLTDGTYTIKSHAIDNAGNTENTYTLTIILDKIINEVALSLNPTVGDASNGWYKTQPTITLTGTDANFDKIEYQWDSEVEGSWLPYSTAIKPLSEGSHVLYYRAIDKAQNISKVGVKNIAWDQTDLEYGPQNITADPNPTSGSTSKIKWEFAKDNIGIDKYEVQWILNDTSNPLSYSKTVGSGTTETDIDQLVEGRWTVKVIAFDASGKSKDNSIDLIVDRTGPSVPNLTLTSTGTGTASLSWNTINDAKDYIIWYGTTAGTYLYGARVGNVTSYTVQGLGAGNYYFTIKAVDAAQNQSGNSNEVNTGNIAGAIGTTPGQSAEGFTEEVLGATTEDETTVTPTPNPSIREVLGDSTNGGFNWWWLTLILGIIPLYVVGKKIFKKRK